MSKFICFHACYLHASSIIGFVNFSCCHPNKYEYIKTKEKLPDIRYTENTVSRMSYIHPSRYQNLAPDYKTRTVVPNPDKKAVAGIGRLVKYCINRALFIDFSFFRITRPNVRCHYRVQFS